MFPGPICAKTALHIMATIKVKVAMAFWITFLKQCHVLSIVQRELKSMIKDSGLYAVNTVTQRGVEAAGKTKPFMLPQ